MSIPILNTKKVDTRLITLDTATRYTGYALFNVDGEAKTAKLERYGLVKGGDDPTTIRLLTITQKVAVLLRHHQPAWAVQEFPTFQGGAKGFQAAQAGDTLQLARLCGRLEHSWELWCSEVMKASNGRVILKPMLNVSFVEWNGQCTKAMTCERLKDHFGIEAKPNSVDNNWADAIMMGKWYFEKRSTGFKLSADATQEDL